MPQVLAVVLAEEHAGRLREASLANVIRVRPACRAVGRNQPRLARAPDRHTDGDHHRQQATAARDGAAGIEHARRVGIEEEPPLEQFPRVVDRCAEKIEPGRAKA